MATSLGRLVLDMAADAAGFERDMQRVSKSAKKELGKVNRELWKAERDLDRARGKVNRLAGAMGALGAVAIAGVGREFRKFAQEANALDKVSKTVSLTVEELQELRFAAEQAAGVTSQTLDMAMQRFSRRVGEAANDTGELNTVVKELGVQLRNQDGSVKSQTELLRLFANEIKNAGSEQEQLRIAFKLFDSEGARMVTLMRQGGDALQEYIEQARRAGGIMSSETVEATVRFNDALNILSENIKGLRNQFFGDLIEPLATYAEFLATTEEGQRIFRESLSSLGDTAKTVGTIIGVGFTAALTKAIAQMVVAEMRVARLSAQKLVLAGASRRAAIGMTAFGRAVAVATGPIGIAVAAIGTIAIAALGAREKVGGFEQSIHDLRLEMRSFMNEAQALDAFNEFQMKADEAEQAMGDLEKKIADTRRMMAEGTLPPQVSDSQAQDRIDRLTAKLEVQSEAFQENTEKAGAAYEEYIKLGKESSNTSEEVEAFGGVVGEQTEIFDSHVRALEAIKDSVKDFRNDLKRQIESVKQERIEILGGTEALIAYKIAKLESEGASAEMLEGLEGLSEELENEKGALEEARKEMDEWARVVEWATEKALQAIPIFGQMGEAAGAGGAGGQDFSGLARAMSSALSVRDGQNLGDSIGNALSAYGTQGITEGLQDAFQEALDVMEVDAESGQIAVASLAVGQAIGGQMGAAIGTVIGGIIGAYFGSFQAGAAIGGAIGGLFDEQKKSPRFNFGMQGPLQERKPSVTPEYFRTALQQQVAFGSTGLDDQTISDLVRGLQKFDRALADAIEGAGIGDAVRDALEDFSFISDEQGLSLDEMMQARFDEVIKVLDWATAQIVMRGDTIEDQLQRLASITDISQMFRLGGSMGLSASTRTRPTYRDIPGPDGGMINVQSGTEEYDVTALQNTILLTEELSSASETLAETYSRLVTSTRSLEEIFGVMGGVFDGTREDMVRFGDSLTKAFGGDVQKVSEGLSRIAETFFGQDSVIEQQIRMLRDRATGMLESIGVANIDAALTESGFARIFESLFGMLTPEDTAILIEAGNTIADLIDLENELASEREAAAEKLADFMDDIDMAFLEATSPALASLKKLVDRWADMEEQAIELGASEDQLRRVRQAASAEMARWISDMKLSTLQLADDFFSVDQTFQQVGSSVTRTIDNMRDTALRALASIDEWLMSSQLDSNSPLMPTQQLGAAESQFMEAFAAATGDNPDYEALANLPQLADQFLSQAGGFYGTSTDQYRAIWDQVQDMMSKAADVDVPPEQQPMTQAQANTLIQSNSDFQRIQNELNRDIQAWKLGSKLQALADATGDTPSAIAEELGFSQGQMKTILETLGVDITDVSAGNFTSFFNDAIKNLDESSPLLKALGGQGGDSLKTMLGALETGLFAIGDVLVQILEQLGGTYDPFDPNNPGVDSYDAGGPVRNDGLAMIHAGEYVVPRGGTLVSESGTSQDFAEVKAELSRISRHLERGNSDRRDGLGMIIGEERTTRRAIERNAKTTRAA